MKTYNELNENEYRAIELAIRDQNDDDFEPTLAYASVLDEDDTVIVAEAAAMISDNTITTLITTVVTANIGTYYIKWRILKTVESTTYTYYHKTRIEVLAM